MFAQSPTADKIQPVKKKVYSGLDDEGTNFNYRTRRKYHLNEKHSLEIYWHFAPQAVLCVG